MLHDSGEVLSVASVAVLFFTSIAANAVGATPASNKCLAPMCVYCWTILVYDADRLAVAGRVEHLVAAVRSCCAMPTVLIIMYCTIALCGVLAIATNLPEGRTLPVLVLFRV